MNVYEIITDRIVQEIDKGGIAPWQKPWKVNGEEPQNLMSHKAYRGINRFLLGCQGHARPYYLSYKQAQALGGQVRKGEKGSPVIFWKTTEYEKENPDTHELEAHDSFILRYYTVFNVSQIDGIDDKIPALPADSRKDIPIIDRCESVIGAWTDKPQIAHNGYRACYRPSLDQVTMPERETFESPEFYYSVLFHELSHSTGHERRLNRKGIAELTPFGTPNYSREELVAEMGAAFLCGETGIDNRAVQANTVAYLDNWRRALKADSKAVVIAAAQAQRAADMILGKTFTN